jgi:hypothetical protein
MTRLRSSSRQKSRFVKGDRVRLTDRTIRIVAKGVSPIPNHSHIDWTTRRGTVSSTPNPWSSDVCILWDGRKSFDHWPKGMVELVEP